jgi:hypothetical protein
LGRSAKNLSANGAQLGEETISVEQSLCRPLAGDYIPRLTRNTECLLPCSQEFTTSSYVRGETNLRRINVFGGLSLVKEKNFVFARPDKKHKAAQMVEMTGEGKLK